VVVRLVVALLIALLCASPVSACAIDEGDTACLIDDAIGTEVPAPVAAARVAEPCPISTAAPPAADPGRGRVFRPPRA